MAPCRKQILCDTAQLLSMPLFTWYVGVRGDRGAGASCDARRCTASLSDESVAKAMARMPPRVRANARLHAFSSSDKDLIDLQITVMAGTGLAALGQ